MQDHTVTVDRSTTPSTIHYAPIFNVAVPFIDRHLDEGRAGHVAFRTVDEDVTYGQLAEQVARCGNLLQSMGLKAGDRVLMIVKDCPEFVYLFWGAIKAGVVPVPVNTLLRSSDYQYMVDDSGCALVVYSPEYTSEVRPALDAAEHRPMALLTTGSDDALISRLQTVSADLTAAVAKADDVGFWLYSSGSTGRPKGAVHRHRDIVVTCIYYAKRSCR